ncbi:MAG: RNA-binding protein [bacterium]
MRVYVGNAPFGMGDAELRTLFEEFGAVDSAVIITNRETGRSRGFGFVEMLDDGQATNAIKTLNDREVDGRALVVNQARPREERRSSPDGGRGRRF